MKKHSPGILLLLAGVVFAAASFPAHNQVRPLPPGVSRGDLRKLLPKHSVLPPLAQFDDLSIPQDPQDQERRVHRDRLKGLDNHRVIRDPGVREIDGQAESIALTIVDGVQILKPGEVPDPVGLPILGSIIVIGTVTSGSAYMNEEHTRLFSEYKVAVEEVLKPDVKSAISTREEITAWRSGGSLQFPSGHITHFITSGRGFPEVGTQYVFFLRRPDETVNDYAMKTAYSVKDEVVLALDDIAYNRPFDGMPVKDFLDKLRKEISTRREGGN